jgi:hypothetical protein
MMANSRVALVCRHCGAQFVLGKGYAGKYVNVTPTLHDLLNAFFEAHEQARCIDDINCSDDARYHFAITEYCEEPFPMIEPEEEKQ